MSRGVFALLALGAFGVAVAQHRAPTDFDDEFDQAGKLYGVDPDLLKAIAQRESGFRPDAIGPANANGSRDYGIMQINSLTAQRYGVEPSMLVNSPRDSIRLAARYLSDVRQELGGSPNPIQLAAAYNAGAPAVKRGNLDYAYSIPVVTHATLYAAARLTRGG